MAITAQDLLSQAKALFASANTELDFRNVIGRAYYAAYHEANRFHAKLPKPGIKPVKEMGVHATLCHQLLHPGFPRTTGDFYWKSYNAGRHLEWMRVKRVISDYQLGATVDKQLAKDVLERADRVFIQCK